MTQTLRRAVHRNCRFCKLHAHGGEIAAKMKNSRIIVSPHRNFVRWHSHANGKIVSWSPQIRQNSLNRPLSYRPTTLQARFIDELFQSLYHNATRLYCLAIPRSRWPVVSPGNLPSCIAAVTSHCQHWPAAAAAEFTRPWWRHVMWHKLAPIVACCACAQSVYNLHVDHVTMRYVIAP